MEKRENSGALYSFTFTENDKITAFSTRLNIISFSPLNFAEWRSFSSMKGISSQDVSTLRLDMTQQMAAAYTPRANSSTLKDAWKFSCCICLLRFTNIQALKNHIYQEHPNVKNVFPFTCNICGQGFFTKRTLKQHSQKHSEGFECSICFRKFSYTRSLIRHQELDHHVRKCRHCKNFFKIGLELDQHLSVCTDKAIIYR